MRLDELYITQTKGRVQQKFTCQLHVSKVMGAELQIKVDWPSVPTNSNPVFGDSFSDASGEFLRNSVDEVSLIWVAK